MIWQLRVCIRFGIFMFPLADDICSLLHTFMSDLRKTRALNKQSDKKWHLIVNRQKRDWKPVWNYMKNWILSDLFGQQLRKWNLSNYFGLHVCLSFRPFVDGYVCHTLGFSVASQNFTNKSFLVCIKSVKYAFWVTLRSGVDVARESQA